MLVLAAYRLSRSVCKNWEDTKRQLLSWSLQAFPGTGSANRGIKDAKAAITQFKKSPAALEAPELVCSKLRVRVCEKAIPCAALTHLLFRRASGWERKLTIPCAAKASSQEAQHQAQNRRTGRIMNHQH